MLLIFQHDGYIRMMVTSVLFWLQLIMACKQTDKPFFSSGMISAVLACACKQLFVIAWKEPTQIVVVVRVQHHEESSG